MQGNLEAMQKLRKQSVTRSAYLTVVVIVTIMVSDDVEVGGWKFGGSPVGAAK